MGNYMVHTQSFQQTKYVAANFILTATKIVTSFKLTEQKEDLYRRKCHPKLLLLQRYFYPVFNLIKIKNTSAQ